MKRKTKRAQRRFEDVQWLHDVREVRHSLDGNHPIFVRETRLTSGDIAPQPTVPFPERHPFCEFNILLDGLATQYIGDEKTERSKGDVMFLGPGVPHYAFRHSYPYHTLTVYFLPLALFEMGPSGDGAWLLSRFVARQCIGERIIRPSARLRSRLEEHGRAISREFREEKPGSDLKLWILLVDALVDLFRWEIANDRWHPVDSREQDWLLLEKALRYLHEHYAEPVYVDQVAAVVGVNPNRMRELFRKTLGLSCSHYVQSLRIAQAKSLLCLPHARVTDVALALGFETLSHFITSFRKQTEMSPTQYMRGLKR